MEGTGDRTAVVPGRARARTRNLEIPRCAIAHLRSGPSDHPGMTGSIYAALTLASRIACQTFIGVSGVGMLVMPSSLSASITSLAMQGVPPIVPDSPQPFAPSGLVLHGALSSSVTVIGG